MALLRGHDDPVKPEYLISGGFGNRIKDGTPCTGNRVLACPEFDGSLAKFLFKHVPEIRRGGKAAACGNI